MASAKRDLPHIPKLTRSGRKERKGLALALRGLLTKTGPLCCLGAAVGLGGVLALSRLGSSGSGAGEARAGAAKLAVARAVARRSASPEAPSLDFVAEANAGFIRFSGEGPLRDALKPESAARAEDAGSGQAAGAAGAGGSARASAGRLAEDGARRAREDGERGKLFADYLKNQRAAFEGTRGGFVKPLSSGVGKLAAASGGGAFGSASGARGFDFARGLGGLSGAGRDPRGAGELGPRRTRGAQALRSGPRQDRNLGSKQVARGYSTLAMGQLKLANKLSYDGSRAMTENRSKELANDAFDQQRSQGGGDGFTGGGQPVNPGEVVVPPGGGAPDLTANRSSDFDKKNLPTPPPVGKTKNMTPYDGQMQGAKKDADSAQWLNFLGMAITTVGQVLLSIGLAGSVITWPLVIIGIIMIVAGMLLQMIGLLTKNKAKDKGKSIGAQDGQNLQGQRVQEYADETFDGGEYDPEPFEMPRSTVKQDVKREQDATYQAR